MCHNGTSETRVVGVKQLRKALAEGKVLRAYLAKDADPAIVEPLAKACGEAGAELSWVPTMEELGKICGIAVGAAAAADVKAS